MPLLTSCASLLELAKRMTTGLVISKPGATAKPVPVDTWALAQGSKAMASSARSILFKLSSFIKRACGTTACMMTLFSPAL